MSDPTERRMVKCPDCNPIGDGYYDLYCPTCKDAGMIAEDHVAARNAAEKAMEENNVNT